MEIKPIQYYIKSITLEKALRNGLIDKFINKLKENGIKVRFVSLILDPVGEPGLIKIGHATPKEAEEGGLRILLDPGMSERVVRALMETFAKEG